MNPVSRRPAVPPSHAPTFSLAATVLLLSSACTIGTVTNKETGATVGGAHVAFDKMDEAVVVLHLNDTPHTSYQVSLAAKTNVDAWNSAIAPSAPNGLYYLNQYSQAFLNPGDTKVLLVDDGWYRITVSNPGFVTGRFYRYHLLNSQGAANVYTQMPYSGGPYPYNQNGPKTSGVYGKQDFALEPNGVVYKKMPDLMVDPRILKDFQIVGVKGAPAINQYATDCEGLSNLCLRYSVATPNAGSGDLHLVTPPPTNPTADQSNIPVSQRVYLSSSNAFNGDHAPDTVLNVHFEWHAAHQHYHFPGFTKTVVRQIVAGVCDSIETATKCPVVAGVSNTKTGFCLEDYHSTANPNGFDPDLHLTSSNQTTFQDSWCQGTPHLVNGVSEAWEGISAGGLDSYQNYVAGQLIDISSLPAGKAFWLEVTVNPDQVLLESDYTNNVGRVQFTTPQPCGSGQCQ